MLTDDEKTHVLKLCDRDYKAAEDHLKALEFSQWPDEHKAIITDFFKTSKALDESITKKLHTPKDKQL